MIERITHSEWFALVAGMASILSCAYGFYTSRIKHQAHSRLRSLEWQKFLMVSVGVGFVVSGALGFYNQSPPPSQSVLRDLYDHLHGTSGSHWTGDRYYIVSEFDTDDVIVTVYQIDFAKEYTRVYFRTREEEQISYFRGDGGSAPGPGGTVPGGGNNVDILEDVIVGTTAGVRYHSQEKTLDRDKALPERKPGKDRAGVVSGYWSFPSLQGQYGDILLWLGKGRLDVNEYTASARLSIDDRGLGTSAWVVTLLAGLLILIAGIFYSPWFWYRRRLASEGNRLLRAQNREISQILKGRRRDDLISEEKVRYDSTMEFYKTAHVALINTLSGQGFANPESSKSPADGARLTRADEEKGLSESTLE
jgi:hypothetical protein